MGENRIICPLINKEISDDDCYDVCLVANKMLKPSAIPEMFTQKEDFREVCKNCKNHNLD